MRAWGLVFQTLCLEGDWGVLSIGATLTRISVLQHMPFGLKFTAVLTYETGQTPPGYHV